MNRNTRHLLLYWCVPLVFGSITVAGLVVNFSHGDYQVPCIVAVTVLAILGLVWFQRRKLSGLLQHETAAPAVAFFRKHATKVLHGQAISASQCGLVFAMYGDFDEARDELSAVSWERLPPIYQGMLTQALAVIVLLQERNYRKAADLAAEVGELTTVSAAMPGSKTGRQATDAFCDACDLVAGIGTDESFARLEGVIGKLRLLDAPICAWALAQHSRQVGDAVGAEKYSAMVRELAPHCTPLIHMDSM